MEGGFRRASRGDDLDVIPEAAESSQHDDTATMPGDKVVEYQAGRALGIFLLSVGVERTCQLRWRVQPTGYQVGCACCKLIFGEACNCRPKNCQV